MILKKFLVKKMLCCNKHFTIATDKKQKELKNEKKN